MTFLFQLNNLLLSFYYYSNESLCGDVLKQ